MKFLQHLDCTPYLSYHTVKEGHKVTGIQIIEVRLPDLTDNLFTLVDPKNNLHDPMIKMNFEILNEQQQQFLLDQMSITRYCIHRVLTHFKLYQSDPWAFQLDQDYYGEEVEKVFLKTQMAQQVDRHLEALVNKHAHERVEFVLKLEYGYLIPSVMNKEWYVTRVTLDELYFSNQNHYDECLKDLVETFPESTEQDQTSDEKSISNNDTKDDKTSEKNGDKNSDTDQEQVEEAKQTTTKNLLEDDQPQQIKGSPSRVKHEAADPSQKPISSHVYRALQLRQYREMLDNFPYPRAITIHNSTGLYKVIDGYHRLAGCPKDENPMIIYCEREEPGRQTKSVRRHNK